MRSAEADLTTKARIRDAAITRFGRDGFAATSVRAIAEDAGVSPALVIHHFRSKDELRARCDEHVVDAITRYKGGLDDADLTQSIGMMMSDLDSQRPTLDYLGRMLLDGSAEADLLLDRIVTMTQTTLEAGVGAGTIQPSSDPRMRAVLVALYGVTPIVLQRQLSRLLDEPTLTDTLIRRMTLPTLELYTQGLYRKDDLLRATRDVLDEKN